MEEEKTIDHAISDEDTKKIKRAVKRKLSKKTADSPKEEDKLEESIEKPEESKKKKKSEPEKKEEPKKQEKGYVEETGAYDDGHYGPTSTKYQEEQQQPKALKVGDVEVTKDFEKGKSYAQAASDKLLQENYGAGYKSATQKRNMYKDAGGSYTAPKKKKS